MKYIKLYENYGMIGKTYIFNGVVVKVTDVDFWMGDEYNVKYEFVENNKKKKDSVTLTEDEIEDRFSPTNEKLPKIKRTVNNPNQRYNIIFKRGHYTETIKWNMLKSEAYSLANYLRKLPKYRSGKILIHKN